MSYLRGLDVVQTEELCMQIVEQNGYELANVINQTEAICMRAVKQHGCALEYVHNQTDDICMEAIKQNGYALEYVHNQTEAICLYAVKQHGLALQYVHNQTDDICMEAIKKHGLALQYVHNQTEAICLYAVRQHGWALQYVHNQTENICLEALKRFRNNPATLCDIIYAIKYPLPQLVTVMLKLYPSHNEIIMTDYATSLMQTYEICKSVICTTLIRYATDLLYRPNNVNALVSQTRWYTETNIAKTVFLKS